LAGQPPATAVESASSIVEYLLDAAAGDFHKHGPAPAAFRNVRFGKIEAEGSTMFLVCGEVQPVAGRDAGKWVEFATLKTSGYEQWLGAQGGGWCNRPGTSWEAADLSSELLRRVEVIRG
jgi:hypothetical protein